MTEQPTTLLNFPRSVSGNPIRWLIVGGAFLIAAIAIGATVMAGNFRERALNSSARELENTVLLLARHFDQQLQDFGAIQQDIATFVQTAGIETREHYKRRMSGADIHQMLKAKIDALSYVGSINLFDADGVLINSSTGWPARPVNVADRPYFKTFKSDPNRPAMLVEPVYSRVTGVWTTVLARKVTGPNGEFLGAIGRGIEPASFATFFQSVALGEDATIAMHHRDGTLLARHPHVEAMIGRNFKTGPAQQQALFDKAHGSDPAGQPDGRPRPADRVAHAGELSPRDRGDDHGRDGAGRLAEQIVFLVIVAGLSVLVIAALLFVVVRKLSRQHRASQQRLRLEKQRLDTAVNNMTQGLLLFDSSQRLVICNQRYIDMYGLSREVDEARLQLPRRHRPSQGHRIVRRRRRRLLRPRPARHRADDTAMVIEHARRTLDPDRQRAAGRRRLGGDP